MIKVAVATEGKNLALKVEGHAGYAKVGNDIVCSSASILAYTVAQFVMEAEHQGDLVSPPKIKLDGGDAFILCEPAEDTLPGLRNMFLFAKMGYALLEYNYPQNVELIKDVEAK